MGLDNPTHWIPILVVLLLVFGARRLPEIGRSLGSGIREFKGAITGESEKPQSAAPAEAGPAPQTVSRPGIAAGGTAAETSADAPASLEHAEQHAGSPTA
jgi:sec-independent protein translocase protein TatA